jgi:hypothetical protein
MGTRVDFYVGRGESAEWLGSYPFDGYPHGVFSPGMFADPMTEQAWRIWVAEWLDDPEQGWPWPWETSATTDYAYAWDDGVIYGSSFGSPWFRVDPNAEDWGEPEEADGERAVFPDMSSHKAVTYGPRSGLIVITPRR